MNDNKKYYVYLAPGNISYFSNHSDAAAYATDVNLENDFSGSDLVIVEESSYPLIEYRSVYKRE